MATEHLKHKFFIPARVQRAIHNICLPFGVSNLELDVCVRGSVRLVHDRQIPPLKHVDIDKRWHADLPDALTPTCLSWHQVIEARKEAMFLSCLLSLTLLVNCLSETSTGFPKGNSLSLSSFSSSQPTQSLAPSATFDLCAKATDSHPKMMVTSIVVCSKSVEQAHGPLFAIVVFPQERSPRTWQYAPHSHPNHAFLSHIFSHHTIPSLGSVLNTLPLIQPTPASRLFHVTPPHHISPHSVWSVFASSVSRSSLGRNGTSTPLGQPYTLTAPPPSHTAVSIAKV